MRNLDDQQSLFQYINALMEAPASASLSTQELPEDLKPLGEALVKLGDSWREQYGHVDPATGAWARDFAYQAMDELWHKGRSFVLVSILLDDMELCMKNHGALETQRYVKTVANIIADSFSEETYFFRMAENRFLLLSLNMTVQAVSAILTRAQFQLSKFSEHLLDYQRSFSYGCTYASAKDGSSFNLYLEEAESKAAASAAAYRRFTPPQPPQRPDELAMEGLQSRSFDAFAAADDKRYMYLVNMRTNVSRWSYTAVNDFDLPGEYIHDAIKVWTEHIHPDDRAAYLQEINAVFSGKKVYHHISYRAKTRTGQHVILTGRGYMLKDKDGNPDYFAGVIVNHGVIENVDPVTNLYNIYMLMNELRRYSAVKKPLSLLMFGVNQFRRVNNSYGFSFGNKVLMLFAQKLRSLVGNEVSLYRLNGVKFCLLLEKKEQCELEALYEQIGDIARNELRVDEKLIPLTLSAGSLSFEQIDTEENAVLAELEYALSISQKERQGKLNHYDENRHEKARRQLKLIDTLIHSVLFNDFHGFFLEYQPQVRTDGRIIGAEALVRWQDEDWGRVPPNDFIPILENDSCFYELGLWILQTALREIRPIVDRFPDFSISVNVSYRQLEQPHFKTDVLEIVNRMGFPTRNLTLELTEHCRTIRQEALVENLNFLRAAGISISADDFGTGYSSLVLLRDLPFDAIKIDRTFVRFIVENKQDKILVRHTIECAKDFGINVCIEGVEDVPTLTALELYHPDYYQGYLYSKPLSLTALLALFEGPDAARIKVDALTPLPF